MTETPQGAEGDQAAVVTQGAEQPTPPPVPTIDATPGAEKPEVIDEALVDRIAQRVFEKLEPRVQSRSAKVAAGSAYAAMQELGLDEIARGAGVEPEKLRKSVRDRVVDRIVDRELSGEARPPGEGQSPSKAEVEDETSEFLAKIAREAGITFSDAELESFAKARRYYSTADWLGELVVQTKKKQKGANVTASATLGEGGAAPPPPPDLRKNYEAELSQIRRGDVKRITDLKTKYRKQGLDV